MKKEKETKTDSTTPEKKDDNLFLDLEENQDQEGTDIAADDEVIELVDVIDEDENFQFEGEKTGIESLVTEKDSEDILQETELPHKNEETPEALESDIDNVLSEIEGMNEEDTPSDKADGSDILDLEETDKVEEPQEGMEFQFDEDDDTESSSDQESEILELEEIISESEDKDEETEDIEEKDLLGDDIDEMEAFDTESDMDRPVTEEEASVDISLEDDDIDSVLKDIDFLSEEDNAAQEETEIPLFDEQEGSDEEMELIFDEEDLDKPEESKIVETETEDFNLPTPEEQGLIDNSGKEPESDQDISTAGAISGISEDRLKAIITERVEPVVERVAREVMGNVAEKLIKEAIEALKKTLEESE